MTRSPARTRSIGRSVPSAILTRVPITKQQESAWATFKTGCCSSKFTVTGLAAMAQASTLVVANNLRVRVRFDMGMGASCGELTIKPRPPFLLCKVVLH
jgi:hypothetical protein